VQRRVAVNWSGGKDSAIALYDILNNMYVDVAVLMTTYTEEYNRVSMHGVSLELVKKQAASLGLDLLKIPLRITEPTTDTIGIRNSHKQESEVSNNL
jgi:diphthamide synthase (EF-2-diphthine--ammonia ligase)